ncbi:MAG: hypothetical protein ACE5HL_11060 [Terriglobia bacterium]
MPVFLAPRPRHWPRTAAALLLASVLWLPACDSFEKNAYRTLKVAKVEYELLQEEAARAFLDARLTQEQWDRFAVAGNRFIAAHTLAADLMKTYQQVRRAGDSSRAEATERQVRAALDHLPRLLTDLRVLLASFDPAQPGNEQGPQE